MHPELSRSWQQVNGPIHVEHLLWPQIGLVSLNGVRRGRFLIVPGADGMLTYILSRWMPWMVRRVMDMDVGRVSAATRS